MNNGKGTGNQENNSTEITLKDSYNVKKTCLYCDRPLKIKDFCSKHHKKAYYLMIEKRAEELETVNRANNSEYFNWYSSFYGSLIGKALMQDNRDLSRSRDLD